MQCRALARVRYSTARARCYETWRGRAERWRGRAESIPCSSSMATTTTWRRRGLRGLARKLVMSWASSREGRSSVGRLVVWPRHGARRKERERARAREARVARAGRRGSTEGTAARAGRRSELVGRELCERERDEIGGLGVGFRFSWEREMGFEEWRGSWKEMEAVSLGANELSP